MTPRRKLRIEATRVLASAGWDAEAIALVLAISRTRVELDIGPPPPPKPHVRIAEPLTGACCQLVDELYCDAPTSRGSAYCDLHYRSGLAL